MALEPLLDGRVRMLADLRGGGSTPSPSLVEYTIADMACHQVPAATCGLLQTQAAQ